MGDPEFGAHELVVEAEGEVVPGPEHPEQPPPDAGDSDPDFQDVELPF